MWSLLATEVKVKDGLDCDVDQWNPLGHGSRVLGSRIVGRFFDKVGNSYKYFPRTHQAFWVDEILNLAHELITLAMFKLHKFSFSDADAMFTRAGAAKFNGFFNN